ncbi:MAG: hypothetical protein HC917_08930 [Richelia sp. SM2_1_7]|nr:hypothetical protein [Richelia sp. SM2_1_7]
MKNQDFGIDLLSGNDINPRYIKLIGSDIKNIPHSREGKSSLFEKSDL